MDWTSCRTRRGRRADGLRGAVVHLPRRFSSPHHPPGRVRHWLVREAQAAAVVVRQGEAVVALEQRDEFVELTTARPAPRPECGGCRRLQQTVRRLLGLRDASHVARLLGCSPRRRPRRRRSGTASRCSSTGGWPRASPATSGTFPAVGEGRDEPGRLRRTGANPRWARWPRRRSRGRAPHARAPARWPPAPGTPHPHVQSPGPALGGKGPPRGDAAGVDPLLGEGISFSLAYGRGGIGHCGLRAGTLRLPTTRGVRRHALLGQLPARAKLAQFPSGRIRASSDGLASDRSRAPADAVERSGYVPAEAYHPLLVPNRESSARQTESAPDPGAP